MVDKDNIIPIGKYKGQPVEVLQGDPAYADWLTAQPWFRERYAGIFQIIVNNFQEPTETPEHNRLQARFLDPTFCRALLKLINPTRSAEQTPKFECEGWDVVLGSSHFYKNGPSFVDYGYAALIEIKPILADDFPAVLRQIKTRLLMGQRIVGREQVKGRPVLVIDRFDAEGATLEQVRQIFGFPIVTIAEIEAALAP